MNTDFNTIETAVVLPSYFDAMCIRLQIQRPLNWFFESQQYCKSGLRKNG
jgi:hypothetical protein